MRAHQIMTKYVTTVTPHASIEDAANIMLRCHLSGVPVVNDDGLLIGIVSESDFLRRNEIGTERKRSPLLRFFDGAGKSATEFVRERGRKVEDVMTRDPITVNEQTPLSELVELMEKRRIKRLPVMSGKVLVGIVTRSNLLRAVASMAHEIPDPTADDDHIRKRIIDSLEKNDWCPIGLGVVVRDGIVHLSGVISEERSRQAAIVGAENVAGVKKVHDHLCWVDPMSGMYLESPEDVEMAKAS
jgi:CBS domain-containing protein